LDFDGMTAELRLCRLFFADIFLWWWRGVFAGVFAKNVVQMVVF
jgi:hypothetical protein